MGSAAQARSAPAAWASSFVTWRKRKAEEAALAQSQRAKRAGAEAASTSGTAIDPRPAAGSDNGTALLQAEAHGSSGGVPAAGAPGGYAALPRSAAAPSPAAAGAGLHRSSAAGGAFGWDKGVAARRGPGAALAGAAAGSSDTELEADEPSLSLEEAVEDAQGASPGGRSSGCTAPATAEGAGEGSVAGPEGSLDSAEAAGEGALRDPGQCLVLVADDSPMAGELAPSFVAGRSRHNNFTLFSSFGTDPLACRVAMSTRVALSWRWLVTQAMDCADAWSCACRILLLDACAPTR